MIERFIWDAAATDTAIALFWEPMAGAAQNAACQITVNGSPAGETTKTHFTVENLTPDTEYTLAIYAGAEECAAVILRTTPAKRRLDVSKAPYFALGDGFTMNTAALQKAMDDCGPQDCVYLPAGVYLTGALRLHSDMELYVAEGATLQGTANPADYLPRIKSRFEGIERECYQSLLNLGALDHTAGPNCQNVLIHGGGTLSGGGRKLADAIIAAETLRLKDELAEMKALVKTCEKPETIPGRARGRLVNLSNCQNIRITNLVLENGPSWNVHMIYSDKILTDHCTFCSEGVWNGDGWDPDSSTNCTLFACQFFTGDDAVAIKSGKNPEGNLINRPCKHIRVFDCVSAYGHGICLGSEMSGGIEDVFIWDCDLLVSECGIELKATAKRGGYIRGIRVQNCKTARLWIHSVAYNDDGEACGETPVFSDCRFENLHIGAEYLDYKRQWHPCDAILLCGFDKAGHEVQNITFQNIRIAGRIPGGAHNISLQRCKNLVLQDIFSE